MPDPRPPARLPLDRAALERVLARAAELQLRQGDGVDGVIASESLSEEQLLEIGKEAGLSPEHLRLAIAEERTRVAVTSPVSSSLDAVRTGVVSATRTVAMRGPEALAALDTWMQRRECLTIKRSMPERIVWEPGGGVMNAMRRAFSGHGLALSGAREVSATVVAVDDRRVLVRLDADLAPMRSAAWRDGVLMGVTGSAASGVAVAIGVLVPVAVVPAVALAAGGWWQARRRVARAVERAQLTLEQVLDQLERGELTKPTLLGVLAAAASTLPRR